jgi:GH15 family glucan-1,4-alpha-glucosidase
MIHEELQQEGYKRGIDMLHACTADHGFVASRNDRTNYNRIWSRDSIIMGLAACMAGDSSLIDTFRKSLITLADQQGPHGEIPSNVDVMSGRISYGGTTGRVDADLWFVIGCGRYWTERGDVSFLEKMLPVLDRVMFLLGAWEFNNRGLIYVPQTGDWADEYVHSGYVLYDQLLYYKAQQEYKRMKEAALQRPELELGKRIQRLGRLIRANYWLDRTDTIPEHVYHEVLYRNGREPSRHCSGNYWVPFFAPFGYGYRFDALANILVSLFRIADDSQIDAVDSYIEHIINEETELHLLPAFHPVIQPVHKDWEELKTSFSYTFKNRPYEYHNGGLWPMVTGFYVADLVLRNRLDRARKYLDAIHRANAGIDESGEWVFPEYIQGRTLKPGGTQQMGWSAAAAVIGQQSINGHVLFPDS